MSGSDSLSPFSAVDSTLGYLYQVRSALYCALVRLKSEPEFLVSIEALDDVAFESISGDITELLQTKHHRKGTANLTDASSDLWKTLRIWIEGYVAGQLPPNVKLYLITTGIAPDKSAASYLRINGRAVDTARISLDATASSSSNTDNLKAYKAYLDLPLDDRASILSNVVIFDGAPSIEDLDVKLKQEVYWAVDKDHHDTFLERLEGWWLRRVLEHLCSKDLLRIGGVELEAKMSDLREQFKMESLPIDDDLIDFDLDDATQEAHQDSTFVRQMEIIKAGKRRVALAISDYYRAFEQRSRWLRDDLVVGMDLQKYEKRLAQEWAIVFESMRDDLGDEATDEAKVHAARQLLSWAERVDIPIRPSVTEPFVCRGSFHILSDEAKIGWHIEFKELLAAFLTAKEGAA